jgi:hypothetical protein
MIPFAKSSPSPRAAREREIENPVGFSINIELA